MLPNNLIKQLLCAVL